MERYNKFVAVVIIFYDNTNILLFLLSTIFLNFKITKFSYYILI